MSDPTTPQEALEPSTAREPITGLVARILTSRELVINKGENDGVTVGMTFEVLDPKAEDIEDPATGEILGSVDRVKVEVRVTLVEARLAVAETFHSRKVNVGGTATSAAFAHLFEPPKIVTEYDTLKTNEKTWEDLDESESFVKTGDPVREVLST